MASNGCDSFMTKWAEFNENTEMDPIDMIWAEFWQSPSFGLARLGKFGSAASAQQLAANINRFFAEDQYNEELTPEETDFIWNLYLRASTPVPNDILITCNVLTHIVNTPADKLASIDWSIFDGDASGSEDEDDDESTDSGLPPSQQLLQPFPSQPAFPPKPTLTAPAPTFGQMVANPLLPGASLTAPLQPPPTAAQQMAPVPGGLLQGGFGQAPPSPFAVVAAAPATTTPAVMHDLPYVTTVIKGLKSSDKSRLLMINVDDDGTGNKLQVGIFITAGEVQASVTNTTFNTQSNPQERAQIDEQNKRSIAAAPGLIPFKLSNGTEADGVCAQLIRGFSVVSAGKMDQECKPDTNRPRSVKRDAGPSAFGVPTGQAAFGMPTQPGLGQAVAGQTQFGSQPTSGGFATPPTSGGFAAAPEIAPPGTRSVQVPDFDKPGTFREAYQIPGGPHPIAVGKKVGVSPGTWYWYQLPTGVVVKSEKRYLGLLDDKSMTKKHGEKQLIRVDEVVRMMQGQYGQNFNQVAGAPAATGPAPAKSGAKSSGRGRGKTATPPTSGGFAGAQGQLPPGFQPMGSVFQVQATAMPPQGSFGQAAPQQSGFQPAAPLPAGFQAALAPPALPATGTTPGILQQSIFNQPQASAQSLFGGQAVAQQQPAAPLPMAFFGAPQPAAAQPAPQAMQPPAQQAQAPQAAPPTNPLFAAMMQTQQQTATIPTGLFGQSGVFPSSRP